jgi:hypothetical protein
VGVGECRPVGTTVLERVIGAFKTCGDPFQIEKIFDHLAAGTAEIEATQGTPFEFVTEEFIHMQDELFVGAVVFSGSFGRNVVGRLEGDGMFCLQGKRDRWARSRGGTTTPTKKPDYFVDATIDPNMDLVPNTTELARGQKADGTPYISEEQAEFFHFLDITRMSVGSQTRQTNALKQASENRLP